ncbi:MAG: hypothetical protein PVJ03_02825 [Chromatiaceae bacterium]|jgi:hypothetical protein
MRPSVPIILAAVNVLLLGAIGAAWLTGRTAWAPPEALVPDPAMFAPPALPQGLESDDFDLHERPLFSASRRPEPAAVELGEAPEPEAPVDAIEQATLLGLAGVGEQGVAIISLDDEIRRVAVGEHLAGWRLTEIEGLVASFTDGAGSLHELSIQPPARDLDSPQPGAPGAAAGPPGGAQSEIAERRQRRQALLRQQRAKQRRIQQDKATGG